MAGAREIRRRLRLLWDILLAFSEQAPVRALDYLTTPFGLCGSHIFASKKPGTKPGLLLAGARGIEPRSKVLETFILTVVLCPYDNR